MKNRNLLYSAWCYKIAILYRVEEKQYYEDFVVITHKNYADIHQQFPKFIMPKIKTYFHDHNVALISAEIVDLECLNW